jgi:hypothetical protein
MNYFGDTPVIFRWERLSGLLGGLLRELVLSLIIQTWKNFAHSCFYFYFYFYRYAAASLAGGFLDWLNPVGRGLSTYASPSMNGKSRMSEV